MSTPEQMKSKFVAAVFVSTLAALTMCSIEEWELALPFTSCAKYLQIWVCMSLKQSSSGFSFVTQDETTLRKHYGCNQPCCTDTATIQFIVLYLHTT